MKATEVKVRFKEIQNERSKAIQEFEKKQLEAQQIMRAAEHQLAVMTKMLDQELELLQNQCEHEEFKPQYPGDDPANQNTILAGISEEIQPCPTCHKNLPQSEWP